jgi:hypothetical protein
MKHKIIPLIALFLLLPVFCDSQSSLGIGMAFGDGGHPAPLVRLESQVNLKRTAITFQGRAIVACGLYVTGGILLGYNIWLDGKPKFEVGMIDEQSLKLVPSVGLFYNKFSPVDKPDKSGTNCFPTMSLKLISEKYTWELFDQRRIVGASITWIF